MAQVLPFVKKFTVRTKIIANPVKFIQELVSEKSLILLRDRPWVELIIISSNFEALHFALLAEKLLELVWKRFVPVKMLKDYWTRLSRINAVMISALTVCWNILCAFAVS